MIAILPKSHSKEIFSFDHYFKGKLVSLSWYILKSVVKSTGFRENLLQKRGLKSVLKESKQTRKAKTVSREKEKVFCVLTCLEAFFCFRGRVKFEDREKE